MWEAPKDSILTISPAIASSVRSDNLACLPAHALMCPSSFLGSVFPQLRSSGSLWHLPVSSNCLLAWNPCPVWCFLPAARSRPGRCLPSLVPLIGFNSLCRLPGPLFSCYAGGTWNLGSRLLPVSFYGEVAPQDLVTLSCMLLSKMKKACWCRCIGPSPCWWSPCDWNTCPCSLYYKKQTFSQSPGKALQWKPPLLVNYLDPKTCKRLLTFSSPPGGWCVHVSPGFGECSSRWLSFCVFLAYSTPMGQAMLFFTYDLFPLSCLDSDWDGWIDLGVHRSFCEGQKGPVSFRRGN